MHFFGDDNQQIYEGAFGHAPQLSKDMLISYARKYGEPYETTLQSNWRLPPPVADFVDAVDGPEKDLGKKCFGKRRDIPRVLRFQSLDNMLSAIRQLVSMHKGQYEYYRAAVICYKCETCENVYQTLRKEHGDNGDTDIFIAEVRGALDKGVKRYEDPLGPKTLEGAEIETINEVVTTAFSSKGLQYDDVFVIVDDFVGRNGNRVWSSSALNVLHVALTRTEGGLFVCYIGNDACQPFASVPNRLYKTEL